MTLDTSWQRDGRLFALFFAAAPLLYLSVSSAFFVSDDFVLLRAVRDGGPFAIWSGDGPYLRPIAALSLYLDLELWGLHPLGFHLTNVLIHGINSFLVMRVARRLDRTAIESTLAGVVFLLLPCHAEAVAWISGRTDIIATFLGLLATERYLCFRSRRSPACLAASLLCYAGALLAKESVVVLPLIFMVYEAAFGGRAALRRGMTYPAAHWGVLLVYLVIRVKVLAIETAGALKIDLVTDLANFLINALKTVTTYWPAALLGLLPVLKAHKFEGAVLFGLCGLVFGFAIYRQLFRRPDPSPAAGDSSDARPAMRAAVFLLCGWALALLPVFTRSTNLFSSESDRFLYLPSVFASILLALLLCLFRGRTFAGLVAVLLLGYGLLLARSLGNWRTAGAMSRSILDAAGSYSAADRLEILNLPDNIAGAYVFRNGFNDAEALFLGAERSTVLTTYEAYDDRTAIVIAPTAAGVSLAAVGPGANFRHPVESLPGCARLREMDTERHRVEFDLAPCREGVPVVFYDGQHLGVAMGQAGRDGGASREQGAAD